MLRHVIRLLLTAIAGWALAACEPRSEEALDVTVIGSAQPAVADPSAGPLSRPGQVLQSSVAQGLPGRIETRTTSFHSSERAR